MTSLSISHGCHFTGRKPIFFAVRFVTLNIIIRPDMLLGCGVGLTGNRSPNLSNSTSYPYLQGSIGLRILGYSTAKSSKLKQVACFKELVKEEQISANFTDSITFFYKTLRDKPLTF